MDAILTHSPLSRDFQSRLAVLVPPDALKLSIGELRQRPFLQMLKYLRSLQVNRLFLPIEDENGAVLLPVLQLLASIVPARCIYLVASDMRLQSLSRMAAIGAMFKLIYASTAARASVLRARREIAGLLKEDRIVVGMPSEQNVLYLNANLWFGVKAGGSVGHISGVVNALLQKGCAVNFATAGGHLLVSDKAVFTALRPPANFGFPWEINYYRFHFDVVLQIRRLMAQHRFDFIYQRMSIANYSGVALSRLFGVPLIIEYNGSEVWVARNWGRPLREQVLAEQVEEANLLHADLVVTISDVLRDELLARGLPAARIVSYPNCIDPAIFNPARFSAQEISEVRHRHNIPSDAVVVTFIGTFGQWHGAEILAHAIKQLIDNHQAWVAAKKVHFLMVGDGLKMPEVRSVLGVHAAGPQVTLAGLVPQQEAPLYLAASDILSSPHVSNADGSRFFGSPTKLFEYMAMGKAIVASDLDQIGVVLAKSLKAEQLPHDDLTSGSENASLALLCEAGSAVQHAAGIRFLVDNPNWRECLGRNARREALGRYTWRHHVEAILAGLANIKISNSGNIL